MQTQPPINEFFDFSTLVNCNRPDSEVCSKHKFTNDREIKEQGVPGWNKRKIGRVRRPEYPTQRQASHSNRFVPVRIRRRFGPIRRSCFQWHGQLNSWIKAENTQSYWPGSNMLIKSSIVSSRGLSFQSWGDLMNKMTFIIPLTIWSDLDRFVNNRSRSP
jgi:hypothetical protein